MHYELNNNTKM